MPIHTCTQISVTISKTFSSIKRQTTKQEKEREKKNVFILNLSLKNKKQCFTKIDDTIKKKRQNVLGYID